MSWAAHLCGSLALASDGLPAARQCAAPGGLLQSGRGKLTQTPTAQARRVKGWASGQQRSDVSRQGHHIEGLREGVTGSTSEWWLVLVQAEVGEQHVG